MVSIAIIGAGISGLAAARCLRDAGQRVVIFEKSHDVGGRLATRRNQGFTYDDGAQYIKPGSQLSISWITKRFASPDLIDIPKPIWTFDQQGKIREGDPRQNVEPRWTYRFGNNTLPKLLVEELDVRLDTCIHQLQQTPTGWQLLDTKKETYGPFHQVLITLPAAQAQHLIQDSTIDPQLQQGIGEQLGEIAHNSLISVMLGVRPQPRQRPFYALVNTDKQHSISWLAWEHEKAPERTPARNGLLIAQMAPDYSQQHWEDDDDLLIQNVTAQVHKLLQENLPRSTFHDVKRWRYALPSKTRNNSVLNRFTLSEGLAFAGDSYTGGRVHLSLENGVRIALDMLRMLSL